MGTVQIVEVTEASVKINTEAFNSVLEKVADLPVVLISINGTSREGKSYTLNHFLRYFKANNGSPGWFDTTPPLGPEEMFESRAGRERCTAGIHLYTQPFILRTKYESQLAVLLLDCQGLFDDKTTFKENAVLFALSNLFSSVLIYNLKSKVDENLLNNIQFFSSYAQAITEQAATDDPLPSLMFLVRDFSFNKEYSLGLHSKGFPSEGNYLQDSLFVKGDKPLENQVVRKEIVKKYPKIDMFLLPFPGKEFLKDPSQPDSDFKSQLEQFILLMTTEKFLVPKKCRGKELTGRELKSKVGIWAKLCEESASRFPPARSLSESHSIMRNEMAIFSAFDYFREKFEAFLQTPKNINKVDLHTKHKELLQGAAGMYRNLRGHDETPENLEKYLAKLQDSCTDIFENYYLKLHEQNTKDELLQEQSNKEVVRSLRRKIEALREVYEPPSKNEKGLAIKAPPKPRRTFAAKINEEGNLIPSQDIRGLGGIRENQKLAPTTEINKPPVPFKPPNLGSLTRSASVTSSVHQASVRFKYRVKNFFTQLFVQPSRVLRGRMQSYFKDPSQRRGIIVEDKAGDRGSQYSRLKS